MLQETDVHNLTNNVTIISKHPKGSSGKWSSFPDKTGRNHPTNKRGCMKSPEFGRTRFPVYEYHGGGGLSSKLKLRFDHRYQRLSKPPRLKGGGGGPRLKVRKSDKAQRRRDRMFAELEIFLGAQSGICQGLLGENSIWWVSISEFLTASESEPDWSKNMEYI